ncbi:hypothetical protein GCM10010170_031930 [Dactylosporangium salmoneum]|uniref:Uncharacterized protein n=1 Tax=Dactylosporangium salmoneum TaxID=53361 RepID=A0ABN3G736_9ACTN
MPPIAPPMAAPLRNVSSEIPCVMFFQLQSPVMNPVVSIIDAGMTRAFAPAWMPALAATRGSRPLIGRWTKLSGKVSAPVMAPETRLLSRELVSSSLRVPSAIWISCARKSAPTEKAICCTS